MARKKKHEEHENHERWLVSYADFITLLFAFFVVMYSVSSVNEGKYRILAESINAAFRSSARSLKPIQVGRLARSPRAQTNHMDLPVPANFTPIVIEGVSSIPYRDKPEMKVDEDEWVMDEAAAQVNSIADELEESLDDLIDNQVISLERDRLTLEIELFSRVFFTSASAIPSIDAEIILKRIAAILDDFPNKIHVEGYTDNRPINSNIFPSNWELSASRAAAVVRLFSDYGIDPGRMASVGYGEFHPIASNESPLGRAQNRRVVIVILANLRKDDDGGDYSDLTQLRERFSGEPVLL